MEPYKGLRPYEEQDQENFFGRDAEKHILVDKILTNKLTLLFAASGGVVKKKQKGLIF